jgi:hypothetical protein
MIPTKIRNSPIKEAVPGRPIFAIEKNRKKIAYSGIV